MVGDEVRPWEETWEYDVGPDLYVCDPTEGFRINNIARCAEGEDVPGVQHRRLQLASAAPDLYRALVECVNLLDKQFGVLSTEASSRGWAALQKARGE